MIRRSRISVRPNANAAGSGPQPVSQDAPGPLPTSQATPQLNQEARCEINKDHSVAVVTKRWIVSPLRKSTVPRDTSDSGGTSSSAALQRIQRFAIKPKEAPALNRARAPKSPARTVVLESPAVEGPATVKGPGADSGDVTASSQTDASLSQETTSPSQQQQTLSGGLSEGDTRPTTLVAVPAEDDDPTERAKVPLEKSQALELSPSSQAKDVPSKPPDEPCPSDKEAMEISEMAKTLLSRSAKGGLLPPQAQSTLSRLLNDSADLQRLAKARKLRELPRKEIIKRKKTMKNTTSKARVKEYTTDPAKMTMRDFIHYLPVSNPMSSYLADSQPENEIVVPPSSARQQSPERAPSPAPSSRLVDGDGDDEQEEDVEADNEQLMVPRVKVAEDGSLIIDEESLTVAVKRAKGPNPVDDTDPILEHGSTSTSSSFRKWHYTKPWSTEETEMFFLAISMVGTDCAMICQLFPHRDRAQIKHKFKREERENSWRVDKAFKERRKLDIEIFSKLLDKILEVQKSKSSWEKETKSPSEEKTTRKRSKKTKDYHRESTVSREKAFGRYSTLSEEQQEMDEARGRFDARMQPVVKLNRTDLLHLPVCKEVFTERRENSPHLVHEEPLQIKEENIERL